MNVLRRTVWTSVAAAAATVLVLAAPAAADDVGILELEQVSGTAKGTINPVFNAPGTPLSHRFRYTFTSGDHHIRTVADLPGSGTIQISFSDVNGDDSYNYFIGHQRVSSTGIVHGTFTDTCGGGSCTDTISRPPGDVVFVLTGFRFSFSGGDHHLDNIGVSESGGQLTTWFNDRNNDDDYTTTITYAWVPRSRFSTVSQVSGTVHAAGSHRAPAASGTKVIRGFYIDNLGTGDAGDNHIRDLGVVNNSSSIDVIYGDQNPADSADWTFRVPYAVLA